MVNTYCSAAFEFDSRSPFYFPETLCMKHHTNVHVTQVVPAQVVECPCLCIDLMLCYTRLEPLLSRHLYGTSADF